MNQDDRPNPDELLIALAEINNEQQSGKLRIFLGMAAGVGKTCAMLRAAHQKLKEGVDVVVGVVETHGRADTVQLTEGLPEIKRKKIEYRGTLLEEMDLDQILIRKPQLVIVDELAHTNVAGSRHEKRYQDVLEILQAGIDVYTAFNVQHLESRKDSVEAITGIAIRETVPDSILEKAHLVELVDIAPSELLKRLKEGKIYLGDKAERAAQNFFKEDKLTALREISLRMTAERVDQDLQRFVSIRQEKNPWQTNERILVAISHSPYSEKLIRATRRYAYNLEAPWIAVHVDTGLALSDEDQAQLVKNLNLARELKAEIITTTEVDIPSALKRICRSKNVTQIIVGRPVQKWYSKLFGKENLVDQLISQNSEVDIHILRQEARVQTQISLKSEIAKYQSKTGPAKYWITFVFLISTAILGHLIEHLIGYRAVGFLFLIAVLIVGIFGSIGSVVFSALLSAFIWNFFFIPPKLTFVISSADDIILCISFFVAALITGFLTNRIRFHEKIIRDREERTNFLYEILTDIANSNDKSEFLSKVANRVGIYFNAECGVILKSITEKLQFNEDKSYSFNLTEKDQAVVQWTYQNQKKAGWSTDTLAQSSSLYLPLKGQTEMIGVFIFKPKNRNRKMDLDQENLLQSIMRQLGVSIERHFLSKRIAENQRLKDSEELHQTLLNSISHEMRTPLTAILGVASTLDDEKLSSDSNYIKNISNTLQDSGERLNRVIENLLDMSRLNSGVLALKLEWHDVSDLIGVVLKKNLRIVSNHKVLTMGLEEMTFVHIDFRLMEHAISNILLNASIYSPKNSEIRIILKKENKKICIQIDDEGPGVPDESIPKIFEKFYRVPGTPAGGTGLGLSIVKSIITLHQGTVEYKKRTDKSGSSFQIYLPLLDAPTGPSEVV